MSVFGQSTPSAPANPGSHSAYVQEAFHKAQARYQAEPANVEAAWQFGRACFDLADLAERSAERARIAQEGIAACQQAVARQSNSAAARYYLGMNQGQLARTKTLGALKLVLEMEREFTTARELDEKFDQAGPDRNLGLLYRDAPSFGSIGDRAKARQHLKRAVTLAPDYPENRLNLIESELKWGERDMALQNFRALEKGIPGARTNLTGVAWAPSWADWDQRLKTVKNKLRE